jgi:hypothetical protein
MDELARLTATQAIMALKARYFRAMDTKDWAALRAVFTDDLVADFRDATPVHQPEMLIHGADPYLAMLAPMLESVVTVHHGHMPEIDVESVTQARGVWAMEDLLWPRAGSALPFASLRGWGHYHERYRCTGGVWQIAEIRLTRLRVELG